MSPSSNAKVIRLYQFLKGYNNIKNPTITDISNQVWKKWLDDVPKSPYIDNNIYAKDYEENEEYILKVRRPKLTECPKIPNELREWVEKGWENAYEDLRIKEKLKKSNSENEENIEEFKENKERCKLFNNWNEERERWREKEIPIKKTEEFFNQFYELYAKLKKESEGIELILGDGLIKCNNTVYVNHPIILQHVKLEFNADIPEFTIVPSERGIEIYRSIFQNIEDVNSELLIDIYNDFEENKYSPIENENTNSFLNRVANAVSYKGKFINKTEELNSDLSNPQIYRKPILFLRKRTLGFGIAIDTILEELKESEHTSVFLKEIVGELEQNKENINKDRTQQNTSKLNPNGIDTDILLTKPANAQQLAVARYLNDNAAVLVQGPPGTGKTHTIANMVGHLLSQGKSILITSYSEKALSVLKEKVVEELQSLCLSLLSTTESRVEMEKTLDEINENRSKLDVNVLAQQIERLEKTRSEKICQLDELKIKLKNTVLNEYRPIVIGGEEYNPIEAAKFINENEKEYSWIPTPVKIGEMPSLSEEEIKELYESNVRITAEEERESECKLPSLEELITPMEFSKLISKKSKFSKENLQKNIEFWSKDLNKYSIEELENLRDEIRKALNYINTEKEWVLETIEVAKEEISKKNWINLIDNIDYVYKMKLESKEEFYKYNPEINLDDNDINIKSTLEVIINKIESGGKISRFDMLINSNIKKVMNSCEVNGKTPKMEGEFKALLKHFNLQQARKDLANRWNRQIAILGAEKAEDMGEDFENTCKKYSTSIMENLNWYNNRWNKITEKLNNQGFKLSLINNRQDLSSDRYSQLKFIKKELGTKVLDAIESQIYRLEHNKYNSMKEGIENLIVRYSSNQNSGIINALHEAVVKENADKYKECYEALIDIKNLIPDIEKRRKLISKLSNTAPIWAKKIEGREGEHGRRKPPTEIKNAWMYTQFSEEIKNRNSQSSSEIQNEITKIEKYIKANTAELAFKKAWKFKLLQFEDNRKQIQAIEGWRQLIRKIGSGKGKRAEGLRSEARKLMPSCQGAIPVWIMPLSKVVENFNPKENKFDVVIIDEASQADVMALVALYLGKKAIIVGDNQQVSPLSIGEKTEEIERLISQYLYDVPNHKLYDGKFSIYDLAQATGYQPIRLKEHFRCVPEIIQYSNILSYNGEIEPLRDASKVKTKPPLVLYRVEDAISKNKVNMREVEAIVSLILASCQKEEYKNKTFGVIVLRGEKQAAEIDKLLQQKMTPTEYQDRQILCGNSANFQGDERDIIFLSMVDANDGEGPMRLTGYGTEDMYKKRYNVAVSRAKDQIWLIHSLDVENDLKPGDIRKELIEYFKAPNSRTKEYEKIESKAESVFEKEVMKQLVDRRYKIVPQWEVGGFRIDMVAVFKDNKVAIECDGEKWHGEEKLEEDMVRQSILERLGWRFIRIRGSEFFKDKVLTMERVFKDLEEMEIYPWSDDIEGETFDSRLIHEIKIIAQNIRDEWKNVEE